MIEMEAFVQSLKRKYRERLILSPENQYPPCHGDKLVKLELVEGVKADGYAAYWQRGKEEENIKRYPIECAKLFETEKALAVRRVLVEGDAGIGKTTLSIIVTVDWADGKLFGQFKLVLLLPLQDKRVAKAESLYDLLKLFHGSSSICSSVAKSLEETEGDNVLIVADGWDELSDSNRKPGSFLYNLIFGNVLHFVSILLTSRPSASISLHKNALVNRYVEVVGFNKENIFEYIQSEFQDDLEKATSLLQQLETNPLIASVCSVPLNCAIVCHLQRTLEKSLPHTMTELYTMIILQTLYRNITKLPQYSNVLSLSSFESLPDELKSSWHCLCEFAYRAIEKDQLVFSEEELSTVIPGDTSSANELLCFGLVQSAHSVLSTEAGYGLSFHFIHLTFQEYLAALYLARLSPDTQLAVHQRYKSSNHLEMVWIFFFGIACNSQFTTTSCLSSPLVAEAFLYTFIPDILNFTSCRFLSHCCFESKRKDITTLVAQAIDGKFALQSHTAHDHIAMIYVLSNTQSCPHVRIYSSGCRLGDSGIVLLANVLAKKSKQLQVKKFLLGGNDLTDHGVNTLFSIESICLSLANLELRNNKIEENGVCCIMRALQSASGVSSLCSLDLSHNPLGVLGIQALEDAVLAGILANLNSLSVAGTLSCDPDINGAVLTTFLKSLLSECPKLGRLDLSDNLLGIPGAQALGRTMSEFARNWIGSYYTSMHNFILDMLDLSKTMLGDKGIQAFIHSLDRPCFFDYLYLNGNEICHHGVAALSEGINSGLLVVRNLTINNNRLGLQGTLAICKMLSSTKCPIQNLSIVNCHLALAASDSSISTLIPASTNTDVTDVTELIQQSQPNKSVYYLNVSENNFTGDNCRVLTSLMFLCAGIRYLLCNYCCFTTSDIKQLLSQLSKCPSKVERWYLTTNEISDEGVQLLINSLQTSLPRIKAIFLSPNPGISPDQMLRLNNAIKMGESRPLSLKNAVLSRLSQDERKYIEDLISGDCSEILPGSVKLMKSLLILVYLEAIYNMSPDNGHHIHVFTEEDLFPPPGLRVVRSRDWDPVNDEDGGEGHVGTVVEISEALSDGGRTALVQWDCGNTGLYRCGVEGKFDLRVLDSAPAGVTFQHVVCDACSQYPLYGMRWKCSECLDYDLCSRCYHQGISKPGHSLEHQFVRYDYSFVPSMSVKVSPRPGARRLQSWGSFPGAVVVRGLDWSHGDDDGGEGGIGIVKTVATWNEQNATLVGIEVLWDETNKMTKCRLGYNGKVDVKCVIPSSKGYYYPEHLPVLGSAYSLQQEQADQVTKDQMKTDGVEYSFTAIEPLDEHIEDSSPQSGVYHTQIQTQSHVIPWTEHVLKDDQHETSDVTDFQIGDTCSKEITTAEREEHTDQGGLCVEDLKNIRKSLWDVRSEWYNFGIELDISACTLDAIREDCHHKVDRCFTAMLKEWLKSVHPRPTWAALIEALRSPPVNYPQLAEEVEKKYCLELSSES